VRPEETLHMARQHMIHQGVWLLLVVSEMANVDGLITTTDLDGERLDLDPLATLLTRAVSVQVGQFIVFSW